MMLQGELRPVEDLAILSWKLRAMNSSPSGVELVLCSRAGVCSYFRDSLWGAAT